MVNYGTEAEVRAAAITLREKHDALEWDASVSDLIQLEGYAQARYNPYRDTYNLVEMIRRANKPKVKALVSVKDQVILLASDIHPAREAFANGHELGHSVLSWHKEILYICDEHDLAPSTQAQMEWEANTFASEILLPRPLLAKIYEEFPTSMDTVLMLRDRTKASIESAGIAYASSHPKVCGLLVLEEIVDFTRPRLVLKKKVLSPSAVKSPLGQIANYQEFEQGHALYQASRGSSVGSCTMSVSGTGGKYAVTVVNTQYRVLALAVEE